MNDKISGPYSLDELKAMKGKTDWDRLRREEAAGSYEGDDDAAFAVDWDEAVLVLPQPKQAVSVRIDADVLAFFKSEGRGYQTRMNAVLRAYMQARKAG